MKPWCRMWFVFGLALATTAALAGQGGPNTEVSARLFDAAVRNMRSHAEEEALQQFQQIADNPAAGSLAADAHVQIANYYVEQKPDVLQAQKHLDAVLSNIGKYGFGSAAADAYLLRGRLQLAQERTAEGLRAALTSFEQVPRSFAHSDRIPAALYYSGYALQLAHRCDDALKKYLELSRMYPDTHPWTAKALLGSAACQAAAGQPVMAMEALQRVRSHFPDTPEAATALNWNTILYRLAFRAKEPYKYTGGLGAPNVRLSDVSTVTVDVADKIVVAHKTGVAVFDPQGEILKRFPTEAAPSAMTLVTDAGGNQKRVVAIKNALQFESGQAIRLSVRERDGTSKPLDDIPAIVATWRGDWLIPDGKTRTIQHYSTDGKTSQPFASAQAVRLAVNALDDVAALDRDTKTVVLFDRQGQAIGRIGRGTGYALESPVDIAFDALGHLYVLDRGSAAVYIFGPQLGTDVKLTGKLVLPEKSDGAFRKARALGVDSAGRLYIFDEDKQYVLKYQ